MNKHKILYFILSTVLFTACYDMNDNIEEYLNRGEINYIGKADSAYTMGGEERIRFFWKINDDPRIEECRIYWNNYQDSIVYPIDRNNIQANGYMSATFNIPEGAYIFNMHHTGTKGYRSVHEEVTGTVYGELYKATLSPRRVRNITVHPDRAVIDWSEPEENVVKSMVHYTSASTGQIISREVAPNEGQITLTDYIVGGSFTTSTFYLPEPDALDELEVTSYEMFFPSFYELDRSGWTATASATRDEDGGGVNGILDGNMNTWWHSMYGDDTSLPHWLEIDMRNEKKVKAVSVRRRGGDLKKLSVKISIDKVTWTDLGTMEFPESSDVSQLSLTLDELVPAQYIRIDITDSHRAPHVSILEVYVTGAP